MHGYAGACHPCHDEAVYSYYYLYIHRKSVNVEKHISRNRAAKPKVWIENLGLNETDKESLLNPTGWLTDSVVNAAQRLLSKKFPHLYGLQDVALGLVMNFCVHNGEFLQILHSVRHWVTVSTIGLHHPNINLYDSLYSAIPTMLQSQIACLMCMY